MVGPVPVVGVLALQGDVSEHVRALAEVGARPAEVRTARDLEEVDGLVIPGGESTTVGKLLQRFDLLDPLKRRIDAGMPVYGTCTGMILLARRIDDGMEGQPLLASMDIRVQRNGFGRQRESFEALLDVSLPEQPDGPFPGVFIRAPRVLEVGDGVEVLGSCGDTIVAVQQGNRLATSFHPELTSDLRMHAHFTRMCRAAVAATA